ncbi:MULTISPECIES: hypothetical protein [unclassified Streptomyces]|uniref:hypothetical protein n=1 Tax=unclassified Streptomyces TaxID=2593676 RepID=UPI001319DF6A|nr:MULTISPECIES: hypothetical protein [unclassified Streptomyces]MYX36506.1 hypothetical protein [Streptomyces sp. SID8377]
MADQLGPLEFFNGEWIIGDPARDHLRFSPEGLVHWVNGAEQPAIPWGRILEWNLSVEPSRSSHSKRLRRTAAVLSLLGASIPPGLGQPPSVGGTLRHPYEPWSAEFTHHARKYRRHDIAVLWDFLSHIAESRKTAHMGDPEWVAMAVAKLSRQPKKYFGARKRAVQETVNTALFPPARDPARSDPDGRS